MEKINIKTYNYPLFTWILTILITPIVLMIIPIIIEGKISNSMPEVIPVFFLLGGFYSLPTLGIFLINYHFLKRRKISNLLIRSISMFVANICVYLTFLYIGGTATMKLALVYCITLTIFIWVVKLKRQQTDL
jgi:hypothetical protein